jgi:hypothetical protein
VLRELTRSEVVAIAFLAEAQLWRTQVVMAQPRDATQWEARIQRMPAAIRGGPYFVLGQLCAQHGRHDDAALAYLKPAILYSRQDGLAAESLLAAARQLETMKQPDAALRLYEELVARFPASEPAQEAERHRQSLGEASP